jgi:hypothetical protein
MDSVYFSRVAHHHGRPPAIAPTYRPYLSLRDIIKISQSLSKTIRRGDPLRSPTGTRVRSSLGYFKSDFPESENKKNAKYDILNRKGHKRTHNRIAIGFKPIAMEKSCLNYFNTFAMRTRKNLLSSGLY